MIKKRFTYSLLLVALFFLQCTTIPTNWNEHFKMNFKGPFGTYIINKELANIFDESEVIVLNKNIKDYLYENYGEEFEKTNYICINDKANRISRKGVESLLKHVKKGNHAFVSLNKFGEFFKYKLGVKTKNLDYGTTTVKGLKLLKGTLSLENKNFNSPEVFNYDRNLRRNYFSHFNSKNAIVLGNQQVGNEEYPVFIKVYYGKGAVYLHSQPIAFTNYYLLKKDNFKYAENVLSYLPKADKLLWDPATRFEKRSKEKDEESALRFFLQHPPLKWSLYVAFIGLLLFILFNARRKQRPIPIIKPLTNSTVDFTHTIANLYSKEKNPKNLVDKKIMYFLAKIRTNYLIDTSKLDTDFIEKLSLKSGNDIQATKYLINTIKSLNNKSECTEDELFRLNVLIENFYKKS